MREAVNENEPSVAARLGRGLFLFEAAGDQGETKDDAHSDADKDPRAHPTLLC